jgi:hypothetical protein
MNCRLLWNGRLVAAVSVEGYSDWPWATGKIASDQIPDDVRPFLEWVWKESNTEDGLTSDPPFPEEFMDNWSLETENGEIKPASVPIVDFNQGTVEWR